MHSSGNNFISHIFRSFNDVCDVLGLVLRTKFDESARIIFLRLANLGKNEARKKCYTSRMSHDMLCTWSIKNEGR